MGLLENKTTYTRCYEHFRGVDFSSDHTQVNAQRLAYAVNMFRDYQSSQGQALETVAGFRQRVRLPERSEVYGIFNFSHKDENGQKVDKVLIHAGTHLYLWANYPYSINIPQTDNILVPAPVLEQGSRVFRQVLPSNVYSVETVKRIDGEAQPFNYYPDTHTLQFVSSDLQENDSLTITYKEGVLTVQNAIFSGMNRRRSTSFVFNNKLYLIDGKNYLVYDGTTIKSVLTDAYIPTTYMNIIPSGENADAGVEYEQRNILTPKFKHTFVADGTTRDFKLNEENVTSIDKVEVYGTETSEYTFNSSTSTVTFNEGAAPQEPTAAGFQQGYAGVVITAVRDVKFAKVKSLPTYQSIFESAQSAVDLVNAADMITGCTIAAIYDNRVFLSGNPEFPNYIFFPSRNSTGYIDPSYFGILNYMQDGVGIAPITGMITVADTLMVLKNDTQQDGSTYFHTGLETGLNLNPKVYPSSQGLSGIGCLGACVNFLDDPIFISRLGVEAVGQLSVRNERANEHRSSLIDAKLVSMDLQNAVLAEWNGYLIVLVDGCMFLADSRQRYVHEIGVNQYEWYYLEGIGVYQGQYTQFKYAEQFPDELIGVTVGYTPEGGTVEQVPVKLADAVYYQEGNETKDLRGTIVNPPNDDGNETVQILTKPVEVTIDGQTYIIGIYYTIHEVRDIYGNFQGYEALLCETDGEQTGGVFKKAKIVRDMYDNVFFGTENGVVCSFNFDMRNSDGEIESRWYSFDGRAILSGCATKMDNCDIPALTKNTVKKSAIVKTKSFRNSSVKIKVRTNKKPYAQVARINTGRFSFEDMNFADFTFNTVDNTLFMVREKEKQWMEKQYYLFTDEYCKPFALYQIVFRYQIGGRFKN